MLFGAGTGAKSCRPTDSLIFDMKAPREKGDAIYSLASARFLQARRPVAAVSRKNRERHSLRVATQMALIQLNRAQGWFFRASSVFGARIHPRHQSLRQARRTWLGNPGSIFQNALACKP